MASTGVNYYLGLVGVDLSRFQIYYDFNQSGDSIASVSQAAAQYSGIPSTVGNFWSVSGSGHFTGQYVQIANASGISLQNGWTAIFVYEREATGSMILFSNYKSGDIGGYPAYLGFSIGVNAANRLFFEGYDNYGPYSLSFEKRIATKNCMMVQANPNGQLTVGWYNPLTRELETMTSPIRSDFVFDSDAWFLGGNPNPPTFAESAPFLGYMDEFLFFDTCVNQSALEEAFKGFFSDGVIENDSFRQSCGMDVAVVCKRLVPEDSCLWLGNTGQLKDELNYEARFNNADRTFRAHTLLDGSPLSLFINGSLKNSGAYSVTGDIYHRGFALSGDYIVNGNAIQSNGVFTADDIAIYDIVANTGEYTDLASGNFYLASGNRFLAGTSRLFINGLRQRLGIDFLEVSRFDLLNNTGSFVSGSFPVYSNEGLFWR